MKHVLTLKPVDMTTERMQQLEDLGLIIRLMPGHHELDTAAGETKVEALYISDEKYGPHQIITVTVNRFTPAVFGTHPDNEDVFLLGDPNTKPMWFIIALSKTDELQKKIDQRTLQEDDFVVFRSKFNDPEVSNFVMLSGTPHGECTVRGSEKPPSFYVTEPSAMPLELTDFGSYEIVVG